MEKIDMMFAFVAEDEQGEGVCGFFDATSNSWMPLVGADMDRVRSLIPVAQHIAATSGKKVRLVRFTQRDELGTIDTDGQVVFLTKD